MNEREDLIPPEMHIKFLNGIIKAKDNEIEKLYGRLATQSEHIRSLGESMRHLTESKMKKEEA